MTTWKRGQTILRKRLSEKIIPYDDFFDEVADVDPFRVEGTAVYMSSRTDGTPQALSHNLEHNRVLHDRVITLTIEVGDVPYVDAEDRVDIHELEFNCYNVIAHYGFAEDPNVPELLSDLEVGGEGFEMEKTTFFLGRETLWATEKPGMAIWREKLFARISRNAVRASVHFHLPAERVVEVGTRVEL